MNEADTATVHEKHQYDSVAERYERSIVPQFRPVAELLVECAAPRVGERVVELAAGTGGLSRLIAPRLGQSGQLTITDISTGMLDVAKQVLAESAPEAKAEFVPADVRDLPFADASFDLVVGQLTPVQDMPEALAESLRVVRPEGRLALAFWGPSYTELDLLNRARARAGLEQRGNTPPGDVATAVGDAGFVDVDYRVVELPVHHESADAYLEYRDSFGRPDGVDEETWNRYWQAVVAEARALPNGGVPIDLTWSIVLLTAARPA